MTFSELKTLVNAIEYDERRASVRFGCDCGCGGDAFTSEEWDEMCDQADNAKEKLSKFGVTFSEEV